MNHNRINRRQFIRLTTTFTGAALFAPSVLSASVTKRTATDLVPLGKTGIKLSRLGIGTGSNGGKVQRDLGQEGFTKLLRYAFDQGITYIDTAQNYKTHEMVREAIKGLPREKLFIQTKIPGTPEKPLEVIDRYRKELDTDYLDSLLVHCGTTSTWDDERKRVLEAISEAQSKKWVRAKGVSCHALPALQRATAMDWVEVHLVRINPQGVWIDTPEPKVNAKSDASHVPAVTETMKAMRARGHGVIGMKLIGNGEFTNAEDREKAIRFVMQSGLTDAVVIGFKNTAEIDEAIERINRALAKA